MPASKMTYTQTVDFLFSLQFFGIKLGLGNINALCQYLGNPHEKFKSVHVAGTNGKGSVCCLIDAVLNSAGCPTGIYTSPHLLDFRERIRVNGICIPKKQVIEFVADIKPMIIRLKATFFEVTTAMAFWYFAKKKAKMAVIETGMGGRLDATNIVDPILTVITPVDMDHTQYLGDTIKKIALEKAGIIKKGTPLVVSNMRIDALDTVLSVARKKRVNVTVSGRKVRIDEVIQKRRGYYFSATSGCSKIRLELNLPGKHQLKNATTALAAIEKLRIADIALSNKDICTGFHGAEWPGRFQVLPVKPSMILDVSHNPNGARVLIDTFRSFFPGKMPLFVLGIMRDKDWSGFVDAITEINCRIVATQPKEKRALDYKQLKDKCGSSCFTAKRNVSAAIKTACRSVGSNEIVVITGSFFTAGEAMKYLHVKPYAK